jgi:hypothetical protein
MSDGDVAPLRVRTAWVSHRMHAARGFDAVPAAIDCRNNDAPSPGVASSFGTYARSGQMSSLRRALVARHFGVSSAKVFEHQVFKETLQEAVRHRSVLRPRGRLLTRPFHSRGRVRLCHGGTVALRDHQTRKDCLTSGLAARQWTGGTLAPSRRKHRFTNVSAGNEIFRLTSGYSDTRTSAERLP